MSMKFPVTPSGIEPAPPRVPLSYSTNWCVVFSDVVRGDVMPKHVGATIHN
jgi:hypothetical protein